MNKADKNVDYVKLSIVSRAAPVHREGGYADFVKYCTRGTAVAGEMFAFCVCMKFYIL